MSPFISIIVPIYNTEKFLEETIESVLNQSYSNWELLLIDDGSTDKSAEICKKYVTQDERIFYFHKQNGGQASARNLGIKKSKGEWIGFLDSDDLWLPSKLTDQIEDVKRNNPDFIYGLGYYYYPERQEPLEPYDWISGERSGQQFFDILFHSCAVNTNTVLFKRALIDQVGYFDEDDIVRGTEDWDLWMRIALHVNKIYGSPKRNVFYRIHDQGIHLQNVRMLRGKIAIYEQYDNHSKVSRLTRIRQYRYVFRELINYLAEENRLDEIPSEFKRFKQKDPAGAGTIIQSGLIKILPLKSFVWVSQKIVYRISYRLESIVYFLFLR